MKQTYFTMIKFIIISITINLYSTEPCSDSLFLELKKRNLMDLSEREYDYLMLFQKNCLEGNKQSKQDNIPTKAPCTLSVYIVPFKGPSDFDNQDLPSNSIFIDNSFVGDGAKTVFLEPGEHTVSLYSDNELNMGNSNAMTIKNEVTVFSNFQVPIWTDTQSDESRLQRKRKTYLKVNLSAGTLRKIIYTVKCNYQNECDDSEWFYEVK